MKQSQRKGKKGNTKVMVFGVFDLLHPGHINFLQQARRLGNYLIVSVARDQNAKKFKGYWPVFNEKERARDLEALQIVDKVVLGDKRDPWEHIEKTRPDVIALGYDQHKYIDDLEGELKARGFRTRIVRLKSFKPARYKSKKIRERIRNGKPL